MRLLPSIGVVCALAAGTAGAARMCSSTELQQQLAPCYDVQPPTLRCGCLQEKAAVAKMENGALVKPRLQRSPSLMSRMASKWLCGRQSLVLEDKDDHGLAKPAKECAAHPVPVQRCPGGTKKNHHAQRPLSCGWHACPPLHQLHRGRCHGEGRSAAQGGAA